MTWRDSFKPIVRRALASVQGKSAKEVRKAIIEAYPLDQRKYWPYKVWCDEVRSQRGLKTTKQLKEREEQGQASMLTVTDGDH